MSREYMIQFAGSLALNRPLQPAQAAYLNRFFQTRRVRCSTEHLSDIPDPLKKAVGLPLGAEGAYFVGIDFDKEQLRQPIVLKRNKPPQGQPDVWCRWRLDPDGTTLRYTATRNLFFCLTWLQYLLDHFLLPWDYQLDGEIFWQGDDEADRGSITVKTSIIEHHLQQEKRRKQLALPHEPILCVHLDAQETRLVCEHLAGQNPESSYSQWFTGKGQHYDLICQQCAKDVKVGETSLELRQICWRCYKELHALKSMVYRRGMFRQGNVLERFPTFVQHTITRGPKNSCALMPRMARLSWAHSRNGAGLLKGSSDKKGVGQKTLLFSSQ